MIKWSNPNLTFRNRPTEQLLEELDKSILEAQRFDREIRGIMNFRKLSRVEKPSATIVMTFALILLIVSILLS